MDFETNGPTGARVFDPFRHDSLPTREFNERTPVNDRGVIHYGAARAHGDDPYFQALSFTELRKATPVTWRTVQPEIGRPVLLLQRLADWTLMFALDNLDSSDLLRFYVDIAVVRDITEGRRTLLNLRWVNADIVDVRSVLETKDGRTTKILLANDQPISLAQVFTLQSPPGAHYTQVRYEHVRSASKPIQYAMALTALR